ncbi:hypothetical protein OEZ85_008330 [Tetradesmus obliquus]|uniref:Metallo-beta-lactamase domain-containing protein n=1 Tax=Tetradesmus obliquus TaxID=3088 RepID=A0ABY8TKG4_TETOB|nr:hypothetical protein OEZ85_008330 [Tetradesmus obliquus]
MLQSLNKAVDKIKEKAAEVRAQAVDAAAAARATSGQTDMPADSRSASIHLCGFDIQGVSIAGQETCLILPRCKLALDIGRCPQQAVYQQTVLITHGHLDHIGGVTFHAASRMLLGLQPARYVVPAHYEDKLRKLLEVTSDMDGGLPLEYDITPLTEGQEIELETGHIVRCFPTVHPVPSQGYILYSLRKKLKAELVGRSQEEIKELRQAGQEVTDTYQIPEVAFTGDTSGELFEQDGNADMYRAKLLIVECTFVDESVSWEQARERGHIHITDLVMHAHKFHNEAILLVHFSPRYKRQQILAALEENMPPALRAKCVPFLNGFP